MAFVKSEGKKVQPTSSPTEKDPLVASQASTSSSLVGTLRDKLVWPVCVGGGSSCSVVFIPVANEDVG